MFSSPGFAVPTSVALVGAVLIFLGFLCQLWQVAYSIRHRDELRDKTGDPWDGRTLEWSVSSPAPFYNFAHTPTVSQIDDYWYQKEKWREEGHPHDTLEYQDIHMPRNTPVGFIIAMFGGVCCFSLIWHMLIPGILGFIGIIATVIVRTCNTDVDYYVPAQEVHDIEMAHMKEARS